MAGCHQRDLSLVPSTHCSLLTLVSPSTHRSASSAGGICPSALGSAQEGNTTFPSPAVLWLKVSDPSSPSRIICPLHTHYHPCGEHHSPGTCQVNLGSADPEHMPLRTGCCCQVLLGMAARVCAGDSGRIFKAHSANRCLGY